MEKCRRILVVNNEVETTELISSFLIMHKFAVETASSAEEVLEKYQSQQFDVIISDTTLPGVTGLSFLEIAGQKWPLTIRILIADSANYDLALKASKRKKIFRFFTKPFEFMELLAAVNQGLANKAESGKHQLENASFLESLADVNISNLPEKLAIDKTQTGSIILNNTNSDFGKLLRDME